MFLQRSTVVVAAAMKMATILAVAFFFMYEVSSGCVHGFVVTTTTTKTSPLPSTAATATTTTPAVLFMADRPEMTSGTPSEQQQQQQQQRPLQHDQGQVNGRIVVGKTEQLLLDRCDAERRRQQQQGHDANVVVVAEVGRTIRDDGLDPIRAVVWSVFNVAQNIVFPTLAVVMMVKLGLQISGYGVLYYWDDAHNVLPYIQIDTVQHLRLLIS